MTMMSNLSQDLVEEILSRVPITSLRAVRSTCKGWDGLTKDQSFTKKHCGKAAKGLLRIMIYDSRACLMSFNLHNQKGLLDPSAMNIGNFLNQVEINKVFQCDGLLLCGTKNRKLVVWNPYLGRARWIQPRTEFGSLDNYSIGYDKINKNYKILRLWMMYDGFSDDRIAEYEIYNFKSNSWRVLDATSDHWHIDYDHRSISLKGNTYFLAQGRVEERKAFLLCFDFTAERFGQRLHLPFDCDDSNRGTVNLSSVRDEQLAVILMRTNVMEVWITNKIQPEEVSWSKFLVVKDKRILPYKSARSMSFFIDEEKRVVVVFVTPNIAYMITENGLSKRKKIKENGCYKEVDFGKSYHLPLVCSYFPSSVQI